MADEKKGSYKATYKEKCWYDSCNCEDVNVADCEALTKENDEGIGRFACATANQDCYNKNFFKRAFQKIACQFEHVIQNICALWDMVQCLKDAVVALSKQGQSKMHYLRHGGVSSQNFYRPITSGDSIRIYNDSTEGWTGDNAVDDKKRGVFDQDMHCYIRWCADGNGLDPNTDNTLTMVVRHSAEGYTDAMEKERGIHWQMTGCRDGAMPCSDTIILPKNQHLVLEVRPNNSSPGTFRVHNIKVEYRPVPNSNLADCLK